MKRRERKNKQEGHKDERWNDENDKMKESKDEKSWKGAKVKER